MTAKPLRKCPSCGKLQLHRLIGTGGGLIFKGSGFYETDYRSESYRKAQKADSPQQSDSKSDSQTKYQPYKTTKPESSTAAKPSEPKK